MSCDCVHRGPQSGAADAVLRYCRTYDARVRACTVTPALELLDFDVLVVVMAVGVAAVVVAVGAVPAVVTVAPAAGVVSVAVAGAEITALVAEGVAVMLSVTPATSAAATVPAVPVELADWAEVWAACAAISPKTVLLRSTLPTAVP